MKKNKKNSYYPVEELYKWVNRSILCLVGCNKADQRIADLEAKLAEKDKIIKQLKALLKATEVTDIHNELADLQINNEWLESENQQLKQQLHELPKKIVEEVEKAFTQYLPLKYKTGAGFYARLNAILKKYGVEKK